MKRLLIILVILFLSACSEEIVIPEDIVKIGDYVISVEIPDTVEEKKQGLMYREHLDDNAGMLFVFERKGFHGFWMKNTLIPLDLIYIAENGIITEIKENFQPCKIDDCEVYVPQYGSKYVLEVNAGFVEEKGINIGDEVVI